MSSRALTFLADVVERHGRALDDGLVEVPFTQAELARRQGCSAGTVAYYLRGAGDLVVARRRRGLVIDLAALNAARPRPRTNDDNSDSSPGARPLRLVATPSSPPSSPDLPPAGPAPALSGDQVLDVVATLADCLAQMSSRLTALADHLLPSVDGRPANPATPDPRGPAYVAHLAGGFPLKNCIRKEESLPTSPDNERGREVREPRAVTGSGDHPVVGGDKSPLPLAQVDELVAPLRALARQNGRPDTLDDNGRAVLARLSEEQLRQGVARTRQEVAADPSIRKPLGLLVAKALRGQSEFFAAPPPPPPPREVVVDESRGVASPDEEAVAAVEAMESRDGRCEELALVDGEVRSWLALHGGSDSMQRLLLRRSRRALRQEAWRRLHRDPARTGDELEAVAG